MTITVTTLTDNTVARNGLYAEWGLSLLIDLDGFQILFDCGQTFTAVHNARCLGLDLGTIDAIVLSHGHIDHTGGLVEVLKETSRQEREVPVYAHPDIFLPRYARATNGKTSFIGLPASRAHLESLGARFSLSTDRQEIIDGVSTTGELPLSPDEPVDERMRLSASESAGWPADSIADDLALTIENEEGALLVTGCAHRGILNTIAHAQSQLGGQAISAVLGGTHLDPMPAEAAMRAAHWLRHSNIAKIGASHCTGMRAAALLSAELGNRFFFNNAGTITRF